jgi:uncharacterized membrane protein YgcG
MRGLSFYSGALALTVLALAGCAGNDGDDTTAPVAAPVETTAALSKEELIAQGDAICAEVNAAVGTLASSDATGGATQAADLYGGMVERLVDLGAPSDDTGGYPEFIAAAEGLGQAESDVQLAAERGEDAALVTAETEASSALASFQSAATTYGFEQCGEGPSAPVPGSGGVPTETEAEPSEGVEEEAEEAAPEEEAEQAPEAEAGGAGTGAGGGAEAGGGTGGGEGSGGGESSGGIGPG